MTNKQKATLIFLGWLVFSIWCCGALIVMRGPVIFKASVPGLTTEPMPAATFTSMPTSTPDIGNKYEASDECWWVVRGELLVPKSAEFEPSVLSEIWYEEGFWHIVGEGEASNAYGVMLPFQYYCKVQYLGESRYVVLVADLR